ncbi:corrinoid protein [Intestinibacter sp.]|uniref:corrinoid protein n=1 Tax=Intestinibacter sp. TaxID=1965304 RepID=UPI002A763B35|nr:corrinoid protein [Intestinibacter sp.]MDY2735246.1 corrinoid protein [Intestinibacter sp.]
MSKIQEVATAVERGKSKKVAGLVQEALDSGASAPDILNAMIDAMSVVGEKFTKNEIFVPEMLVAARAMQKGVEVLKPLLMGENAVSAGKMIMGTVAGDLHDIGKNLVIMMLESAGFEVIDLGVDVPAEKFIEALDQNPDVKIVGASALLTTTMPALKDTVKALNEYPNRDKFKVMVGGAPITQEFADEIGADAYTEDAAEAAQVAKKLVG